VSEGSLGSTVPGQVSPRMIHGCDRVHCKARAIENTIAQMQMSRIAIFKIILWFLLPTNCCSCCTTDNLDKPMLTVEIMTLSSISGFVDLSDNDWNGNEFWEDAHPLQSDQMIN
jgi:hypothetical protein